MKTIKLFPLLIFSACLLMGACAKKDINQNATDPRDNIGGTWSLTDSTFIEFSKSVPAMPLHDTVIATIAIFSVSSDATKSDQININDLSGTGIIKYAGTGVQAVTGGTGFNIPSQTVKDTSGNEWTFSGLPVKTVGSQSFSGFMTSDNKLSLSFSGTLKGKQSGISYVVPFKRLAKN